MRDIHRARRDRGFGAAAPLRGSGSRL